MDGEVGHENHGGGEIEVDLNHQPGPEAVTQQSAQATPAGILKSPSRKKENDKSTEKAVKIKGKKR